MPLPIASPLDSLLRSATTVALACVVGCAAGSTDPFGSFGAPLPTADGSANDDGGTGATGTTGGSDDAGDTAETAPGSDGNSGDSGEPDGDASTGPVACDPPCGADEECLDGTCFPVAGESTDSGPMKCHDVEGEYAECLGVGNAVDVSGCGGNEPVCITGGDPVIAGICAVADCTDECDCPAAPATGTAVAACSAITGGDNLCFLDCSAGQTCPTSMVCFAEVACVFPGEGADGEPFGDCFNNGGSICGLDGICLSDDVDNPTVSVCTQECANVGECPAPPPGGNPTVMCTDVTDDGQNECILDCTLGTCPTGMTCFGGTTCLWN